MNTQSGSVLVVVLWAIAVMALVLMGAMSSVQSGFTLAQAVTRQLSDAAAGESSVEVAAARLLTADPGKRWVADGRPYLVDLDSTQVRVRVWEVGALLDVNRADPALMQSAFERILGDKQGAETIAAAVERARGGVEVDNAEPGAAVGFDPSGSQRVTPRQPLNSELQLLALLPRYRQSLGHAMPYLTAYGHSGRLNAALAPKDLLDAVPDISAPEVTELLAGRANGRLVSDDAKSIATRFNRYFDATPNDIYRLDIEAHAHRYTVVIRLGRDQAAPFYILDWRSPT